MHNFILVFKCLNYLVHKYSTQYFTRNADLYDHATRRLSNDLHPPKAKRNMVKQTFKYAGAIYFISLPNCVKRATSVNSFILIFNFIVIILISYFLADTFYTDLARFFNSIIIYFNHVYTLEFLNSIQFYF